MNRFYRSLLWTGIVAAGLAGCGDDVTVVDPPPPPPPPAPTIQSVTVAPDGVQVSPGQTIQMTAQEVAQAADALQKKLEDIRVANEKKAEQEQRRLEGIAKGMTRQIVVDEDELARFRTLDKLLNNTSLSTSELDERLFRAKTALEQFVTSAAKGDPTLARLHDNYARLQQLLAEGLTPAEVDAIVDLLPCAHPSAALGVTPSDRGAPCRGPHPLPPRRSN